MPPQKEERNRRWVWLLLAALLLGLLAAAAWAFMRGNGAGDTRQVPSVVGISYDSAKTQLENLNFTVEKVEQTDENVPKDEVMEQNPEAGTMADVGSTVTLTVSTGVEQVEIPQLSGYNFDEAKDLLEGKGLQVRKDENESSAPQDEVINSNPPAGEMVDAGSTVTLIVSKGESRVPNVVGLSGRQAKNRLEDAGFDVSIDGPSNGTVTDQDPGAGSQASSGSEVSITTESDTGNEDNGGGDQGNGDGNGGGTETPSGDQTNGSDVLGLN